MTVVTRRQLAGIVVSGTGGHVGQDRFLQFWTMSWWLAVKGYHAVEFAVLAWLLVRAWPGRTWICLAGAALYALSDEVHQVWVPHRGGKLSDVCVDLLGIGLVWFFGLRGIRVGRSAGIGAVFAALALIYALAFYPFGDLDWIKG